MYNIHICIHIYVYIYFFSSLSCNSWRDFSTRTTLTPPKRLLRDTGTTFSLICTRHFNIPKTRANRAFST